jgi:hypothetical protein
MFRFTKSVEVRRNLNLQRSIFTESKIFKGTFKTLLKLKMLERTKNKLSDILL